MPRYSPVGKCIYCGTSVLPQGIARFGDEHIIPLSFGGNLILPESACKDCERIINSQIETPILSHEWGNFRTVRSFPTRKKGRRTHVDLHRRDGSLLRIPVRDYSSPTPLYLFNEARILSGLPFGSDHLRWTMKVLTDHDAEIALKAKYPEWDERHRIKTRPHEFARLIAKIGFGYAAAELGPDTFDPIVTDIILGRSNDYFFAVGGKPEIEPAIPGGDHITQIHLLVQNGAMLVIVNVRLFSQTTTPTYHAVVGRIDTNNPKHVAAFEQHRLNGRIKIIPLDER